MTSVWPFGKKPHKQDSLSEAVADSASLSAQCKEEYLTSDRTNDSETADALTESIDRNVDEGETVYNVLDSIEQEVHENHEMLVLLMKKIKSLDARCKRYEATIERLGEYLEQQTTDNVRQHNRSLRMRVPIPFKSTHTPGPLDADDAKAQDVTRGQCPKSSVGGACCAMESSNGKPRTHLTIESPLVYPFGRIISKKQPTCSVGFQKDV